MQITMLRSAAGLLAFGRARNVADAWRQRGEDGIEMAHHAFLAADHHAIAAVQSPNTAACSHIHIMNFLRRKFLRAPDVVHVTGIAAVNQTARGFWSFSTRSASEEAPTAFSFTKSFTFCGDRLKTTH